MIRLENVSLDIYGANRRILSDINWHIMPGENWILFGRNGSGKTKLLEIVTGYIYPTEGKVYRFGLGQTGNDIRDIRTRIGYISSSIKEKFSVREKVIDSVLSGLYASVGLYRRPSKHEYERASRLIADLGLAGREKDPIGHLSDGEKQKVMMLRALVNDPELLIFDEPAAGLDITAREDLLDSINAIASRKNIATVYVTHHVEEITPLFRKIYIIDQGTCCYNGTIEDAVEKQIFSKVFGRKVEVFRKNNRYHSSVG